MSHLRRGVREISGFGLGVREGGYERGFGGDPEIVRGGTRIGVRDPFRLGVRELGVRALKLAQNEGGTKNGSEGYQKWGYEAAGGENFGVPRPLLEGNRGTKTVPEGYENGVRDRRR